MIGIDEQGKCWLIAEADTYHNVERFVGMGSTEDIEISRVAFDAMCVGVK
jgi:hypothetical protein